MSDFSGSIRFEGDVEQATDASAPTWLGSRPALVAWAIVIGQFCSDPQKGLNKELCRTDVVGIFPNRDAMIRLAKARLRIITSDLEGVTGHTLSEVMLNTQ